MHHVRLQILLVHIESIHRGNNCCCSPTSIAQIQSPRFDWFLERVFPYIEGMLPPQESIGVYCKYHVCTNMSCRYPQTWWDLHILSCFQRWHYLQWVCIECLQLCWCMQTYVCKQSTTLHKLECQNECQIHTKKKTTKCGGMTLLYSYQILNFFVCATFTFAWNNDDVNEGPLVFGITFAILSFCWRTV